MHTHRRNSTNIHTVIPMYEISGDTGNLNFPICLCTTPPRVPPFLRTCYMKSFPNKNLAYNMSISLEPTLMSKMPQASSLHQEPVLRVIISPKRVISPASLFFSMPTFFIWFDSTFLIILDYSFIIRFVT